MRQHIATAGVTWATLVLATIAILATGTDTHLNLSTPTVNQPTCVSQTMEVVPCP